MLSLEEFYALPDLAVGKRELIGGEVHELGIPKWRHSEIANRIWVLLYDYSRQTQLDPDRVAMSTGFEINCESDKEPSWLMPDVAVLHPEQRGDDYWTGAPLLAVEVVSASNTDVEIERKRNIYLRHGANEVWVINRNAQTIQVHRSNDLQSDLFPGLLLTFKEISG